MGKLEGKVAVITGGRRRAWAWPTARLFVEEGAYVFVTGRRQAKLDEAVKVIGRNVTGVQGDARTSPTSTGSTRRSRRRRAGSTCCSPTPGPASSPRIGEMTEEQFDRTFGLNVRGTLFTVQKALPLFRDGGSIILNGSIAARWASRPSASTAPARPPCGRSPGPGPST